MVGNNVRSKTTNTKNKAVDITLKLQIRIYWKNRGFL